MTPITGLYAAALVTLVFGLVLRVVFLRRTRRVGIGDGEDRQLAKAIRAHANAAETVPIALLMMLVIELGGASATVIHVLGASLVFARCIHAWGLSHRSGTSLGRFWGTALTWLVVLTAAVIAVRQWIAAAT